MIFAMARRTPVRLCLSAALAGVLSVGTLGCMNDSKKMDDGMNGDMKSQPSKRTGMKRSSMGMNDTTAEGDIIAVATGEGMSNVTTLVAAVKAAGLVETLQGPGPFTVFAPTNAAFNKLPPGTVDDLLKPENKEKLREILLYHVVPGRQDSKAVMSMSKATTAEGDDVMIKTSGGKVMVGTPGNMATVTQADIPATNGVIHQIDTVLMPPKM